MRGAQSEGGSAAPAPGAGLRLRCRPCLGLGGCGGPGAVAACGWVPVLVFPAGRTPFAPSFPAPCVSSPPVPLAGGRALS